MVDTIKMSEFGSGGDIENNNTTIGLESSNNVRFNNPWTFLAPGSTGDRPTPSSDIDYRLRLNTTFESYEYYSPVLAEWIQIQDSIDVQTFPFVIYTAEPLLPNSFNLGTLGDGILKQSVLAGVATPDIAINGTDYYGPGSIIPVTDGGTGADTALDARINLGLGPNDTPGFASIMLTGNPNGPYLVDINNNVLLYFNTVGAGSINYPWISNAIAGQAITYGVAGNDTNIDILFLSKGTGDFSFKSLDSTGVINYLTGTSYQHSTLLNFPNTANTVNVTFQDTSGTLAYLSDVSGTVTSLTGTANQVLVNGTSGSPQTGAIALALPQSIDTTSQVQFDRVSFSDTTHGILGTTTNNDASSGYVGEYITQTATVVLASGVVTNAITYNLEAGDYDVWGEASFLPQPTASWTIQSACISTTSATFQSPLVQLQGINYTASGANNIYPIPAKRITLSAATNIYLVVYNDFSAGAMNAEVFLYIRRRR